jgi:transcription initiation factor TFIID subunit TAF12
LHHNVDRQGLLLTPGIDGKHEGYNVTEQQTSSKLSKSTETSSAKSLLNRSNSFSRFLGRSDSKRSQRQQQQNSSSNNSGSSANVSNQSSQQQQQQQSSSQTCPNSQSSSQQQQQQQQQLQQNSDIYSSSPSSPRTSQKVNYIFFLYSRPINQLTFFFFFFFL